MLTSSVSVTASVVFMLHTSGNEKGKPKHGGDRTTKKQDAKNAPCPPPTVTEVAKDLKVSERKVKQMIDLDKNADPEIKQELIENKIEANGEPTGCYFLRPVYSVTHFRKVGAGTSNN